MEKTTTINLSAESFRTAVCDNREEVNRVSAESLGITPVEYKALTDLYTETLDAITAWASAGYRHADDVKEYKNNAFSAMKNILALFTTDDNRVIVDDESLATLRDFATKPAIMYSAEYKKANKLYKDSQKTLDERIDDIMTFNGIPARLVGETISKWCDRIAESGVDTMQGEVDMCEMLRNANATMAVRAKAVKTIQDAGKWHWRVAVPVHVSVFADMVENYVADCILDGYNLKSSKVIRDEKAAERAANKTK